MRLTIRLLVLVIGAGVAALPSQAQLRQVAATRLRNSDPLLDPLAQKDLKLTAEQIARLTKVIADLQARERTQLALLAPLGKDQTSPEYQELKKQLEEERKKAVAGILLPDQMKRLGQLEVQQRGLSDPETQQILKLTAEQKEKLASLRTEFHRQMEELILTRPGKESLDKMDKLGKELYDQAMAVLTEDQRKRWKEMTGEPVVLPPPGTAPGQVLPLQRIDPKDIRKKDPNIPDIYRTKPKKIDI